MADVLRWSPTEFWSVKFDPAKYHLKKTSGALAVSAGRTWTTSSVSKAVNAGYFWRPFRFDMGSAATAMNFIRINPPGGSNVTDTDTAAVSPAIFTADIG